MNIGELGIRLRNTILTLVVCLTLAVNLVFAVATLVEPISLYTLLVYFVLLYALVMLLEQQMLRDEDVKEAMTTHVYPARMRTPLRVGFLPYVGVWLLWWLLTQLFFDAGLVFENGFVIQLLLVPLAITALAIDSVYDPAPQIRHCVIAALLVVTAVALFFPTRMWAPQHTGALATAVRAVLYFFTILAHDYVSPANVYANLGTEQSQMQKTLQQQLYDNNDADLEAGNDSRQRRSVRVLSIVDAYQRIDEETLRVREFIALSSWLLVTPLAISLLLFPLAIGATFYAGRRQKWRTVDVTEEHKVHPVPVVVPTPPPPVVVVAPTPPPAPTPVPVAQPDAASMMLLPRIQRRGTTAAYAPLPQPVVAPPVMPPPQATSTQAVGSISVRHIRY